MPEDTAPPLRRTDRTTLKRLADRGSHDRAEAYAVLDEGLVAHVGIVVDGAPVVIPMAYGRRGDDLVLHGSVASRLLRALDDGQPVCVTVTHLDGLVVARSTFHHSMNYRSVVVMGTARRLRDPDEAAAALEALVEHLVPGRTAEARPPDERELRQTAVVVLPIDEASVKSRTGGPNDEPADVAGPHWAGVLPLAVAAGTPRPSTDLAAGIDVPPSVAHWPQRR